MTIHYRNRGDDVILDEETNAAYEADEAVRLEARTLAKRNVVATGRPCDVFAHDGATILERVGHPAKVQP